MNNLCAEFPNNCFAMMGLHPCDVKADTLTSELQHVQEELAIGKHIAIGEIGLDLHWDKSTLEIQKKAFIQQIEWAKHYNLPIAIHVRNSFTEAIEILEKINDKIISLQAPTLVVTDGMPAAPASNITRGCASLMLVSTNISILPK